MKNLIGTVLLYAFLSCSEKYYDPPVKYDLSQSAKLDEPEIIVGFDDRFPVWITVKDSIAIIIEVHNNSSFIAVNVNTKKVLKHFGNRGLGPEDVIDPDFNRAVDTDDFVPVTDWQSGKLIRINLTGENRFKLERFTNRRLKEFGDRLCVSDNFAVFRRVHFDEPNMFYINDMINDSIIGVDCYPDVEGLASKNNMLAPRLALHEQRNRIAVGMYYIDMFSLYDLTGKRLKSIHFSDNYLPPVNDKGFFHNVDTDKTSVKIYPTNDFCYLLRTVYADDEVRDIHLIQVDWDGNVIKSHIVSGNLSGGFCIDEKNKKMYAIKHSVTGNDEMFYIVAYSLL
jgi:hypothetical protein